MRLSTSMLLLNATLTNWRAARQRRQRLERDMACFVTAAERQDFLATLERYPDAATGEARDAFDRQLARARFRRLSSHAVDPTGGQSR